MRKGHVKLNDEWYMLFTDARGRVRAGNAQRLTGPWATQISQGDRTYHDMSVESVAVWDRVTGGLGQYKGQDMGQYRRGSCDTRSGEVVLPARVHGSVGYLASQLPSDFEGDLPFAWFSVGMGGSPYAESDWFTLGETEQIRTLGVMVRRVPTVDYGGGWPFQVQLWDEMAAVMTATVEPLGLPRGGWCWYPATAASVETVTAGTYCIRVSNPSGPIIHAGMVFDGEYTHMYYKVGDHDRVDGPAVDIVDYVGEDEQRRTYAAVNEKVMVFDRESGDWAISKGDFMRPVYDLEVYQPADKETGGLWAAVGASAGIWSHTGESASETWVQGSYGGQVLAVHDALLWRAEGHEVSGSTDGNTWGTLCQVGHRSEPVIDMVSQQGHLFARTRSGVFQIDYEAGYPGGTLAPIATRVVNLETDPSPHRHPAMMAWGAGVMFPLWYDLAQYEAGLVTGIGVGRGQALLEAERLQVYGLHATNRGVYAALDGDGEGYGAVNVYQRLAYEGGGSGWHPLFRHPTRLEEVQAVYVSPEDYAQGSGRLWFGAGWGIQYIDVPLWTQARHLWGAADYEAEGYIDYTTFDAGKSALTKDWIKVRARVQNATTGRPVTYKYQMGYPQATAGAWATLGQVATTGVVDLSFPTGTSGYAVTLRAVLETDDEDETPVVEATELWYQDILPPLHPIHLTLVVGPKVEMLDGIAETRSVAEQLADLMALADEDEGFAFENELGQEYTVRLTQLGLATVEIQKPTAGGDTLQPSYAVQVDLMVV